MIQNILGGVDMKYERPELEIILLEMKNIVTESETEGSGYGDGETEEDDF